MKKLRNNVYIYFFFMLAFLASMLYGIFYGPSHPWLFFWMVMSVFAGVVSMYASTTLKDVILLIGGMLLLGLIGQLVNVQCICIVPVYYLVAKHFLKMLKTSQLMDNDVK